MIKGIIFDLGSTLIQFTGDWDTVRRQGAEEMATWYLKKKHVKLDGKALVETFLAEVTAGQQQAIETKTEVLAQDILRRSLQKIDAPKSAEAFGEAAIKVFFGPEHAHWQPYPDAADTLKQLKKNNYRLGVYSNASDDPLVQRLINKCGLRPWLSPTFSSAGWGWRKPQPNLFQLIASRWQLSPTEIVVVGDKLNADILGAHNAGMKGILATMAEPAANTDNLAAEPAAVIRQLSTLPGILGSL